MMSNKNTNSGALRAKLYSANSIIITLLLASTSLFATEYEVPPSSATSANVPWIPDSEMERCVKLYNESKWLEEELNRTSVNQYSQESVDAYNSKVSRHSKMIDDFNTNCAGKQSESAYRAAENLNQQQSQKSLSKARAQ